MLQMLSVSVLTLAAPTLVALGILNHLARRHDEVGRTSARALSPEQFNRWSKRTRRHSLGTRVISVLLFTGLLVRFFVIDIQLILSDSFGFGLIDHWGWGYYAVPVAGATLGVLVHTLLSTDRGTTPTDVPAPVFLEARTTWSFASTPWIVTWVFSATLLIITVVSAGLIADVDEQGRHAALSIGAGGLSATTEFLGWYYGAPILIGVAVLAVVTAIALGLGARTSLPTHAASGRTIDIVLRTLGARAVLSIGAGGLMVGTGLSWTFISGALRVTASGPLGSLGTVHFDTGLAGLSWGLQVAAWLITGLGLAATLLPAVTRWPQVREEATLTGSVPSTDDPSVLHRTLS